MESARPLWNPQDFYGIGKNFHIMNKILMEATRLQWNRQDAQQT